MPNYAPGYPIDVTENGDSIFNEAEKLKSEFVKIYDCLNEVVNVIIPNLITNAINSIETIPKNLIAIWSGSANNVPSGWLLCDGSNNTPDLRDKFIIGAGNNYKVGQTGGEESHALTKNEIPEHKHYLFNDAFVGVDSAYGINAKQYVSQGADRNGNSSSYVIRPSRSNTEANVGLTSSIGDSKPHNNIPPFYALCYIMKV